MLRMHKLSGCYCCYCCWCDRIEIAHIYCIPKHFKMSIFCCLQNELWNFISLQSQCNNRKFYVNSYIDRKNIEQIEHDNIGLQKQTRWSIKTKSVCIFFSLVCSIYILQQNGDLLRPFVWYHMIANSHELNLKCLCQYNDCIVYLCIVSPTQARNIRILQTVIRTPTKHMPFH